MAKTKALISFAVTAKLICAFVFAYADCCFSHAAAHMMKFVKAIRVKVRDIKKFLDISLFSFQDIGYLGVHFSGIIRRERNLLYGLGEENCHQQLKSVEIHTDLYIFYFTSISLSRNNCLSF